MIVGPDPDDDKIFFTWMPFNPKVNLSNQLSPEQALERHDFFVSLIEKIEVGRASARGVRFEPERPTFTWRTDRRFRFPSP